MNSTPVRALTVPITVYHSDHINDIPDDPLIMIMREAIWNKPNFNISSVCTKWYRLREIIRDTLPYERRTQILKSLTKFITKKTTPSLIKLKDEYQNHSLLISELPRHVRTQATNKFVYDWLQLACELGPLDSITFDVLNDKINQIPQHVIPLLGIEKLLKEYSHEDLIDFLLDQKHIETAFAFAAVCEKAVSDSPFDFNNRVGKNNNTYWKIPFSIRIQKHLTDKLGFIKTLYLIKGLASPESQFFAYRAFICVGCKSIGWKDIEMLPYNPFISSLEYALSACQLPYQAFIDLLTHLITPLCQELIKKEHEQIKIDLIKKNVKLIAEKVNLKNIPIRDHAQIIESLRYVYDCIFHKHFKSHKTWLYFTNENYKLCLIETFRDTPLDLRAQIINRLLNSHFRNSFIGNPDLQISTSLFNPYHKDHFHLMYLNNHNDTILKPETHYLLENFIHKYFLEKINEGLTKEFLISFMKQDEKIFYDIPSKLRIHFDLFKIVMDSVQKNSDIGILADNHSIHEIPNKTLSFTEEEISIIGIFLIQIMIRNRMYLEAKFAINQINNELLKSDLCLHKYDW